MDVAVSVSCPLAPTLFYSLLNTALSYDPVGWGVPYASAIVSDTAEPLADICLQVLDVLLDYAPLIVHLSGSINPATPPRATGALTARCLPSLPRLVWHQFGVVQHGVWAGCCRFVLLTT